MSGASLGEEMMAASILSAIIAEQNACSVGGWPLSQASLKQTPAPAGNEHTPTVCKHWAP